MEVLIHISIGELVDKLSILVIKERNITDNVKLNHVKKEAALLSHKLNELKLDGVTHYLTRMIDINSKLWKIEDDIREKERQKKFDQEFIDLARAVYHTNDQRFEVKNEINARYSSSLVEVKSYKKY